ncbi:MAG: glycoside hydrolase family 9 protein, partial [Chthoniobacterales bacterium]|nr:glycoside hydrolase family 9 protein [Chthoniobacterales bacterium]
MKSTGHYCLIKFQNGLCLTLAILCSCSLFTKGFSQTHNYSEALQKALFFYETQTSGYTPLDHRVEWRGDSCIRDGSDVGRDLTGGWYDAGDGVVWTGNDAFGATMLAWALYRHRQIFIQTGQYQIAIDRVREISNYLEKIVQLDSNGNVVRIYCGKGAIRNSPPNDPAPRNDRTDGCPNEVMDTVVGGSPQTVRPSYWVDSSTGGADVAGAVAAALAANSIVLREYGDVARANQLLELAKKVYNWGEANPNQQLTIDGTTTTRATRRLTNGQVVTIPDYPSRISTWTSRMIYACAWLHRADIAAQTPGYTNAWVTKAHTLYNSPENASRRNRHWSVFTTGQEHNGAYTMLAADTGNSTFVAEANAYANFWLYDRSNHTGRTTDPTVTPEGFIARGQGAAWNVNYLLDQAPPLLDWADSSHNTNSTQKNRLIALFTGTYNAGNNECPVKQIDYILGSNSKKLSYLAGYKPQGTGYDWVRNLLYRSTNWDYGGFGTPTADKTQWNRFVPYGVVAPGPDHTDYYPQNVPLTSGYVLGYQEPIIYSGGILTVLARNIAAGGPFAGQPLHTFPEWEQRPSDYQTRYFFAQAILDSSNRTTVYVNNRAVFPPREINTLGFRFYFTPDGVAGNQVTCSATGIGLLSGETVQVTGPFQVGTSSTWYFNIRLVNAMVVPGEFGRYYRRVQLTFSQPSGTFSFSNDHSGAAITSTLSTIANIPVYDTAGGNWRLLGGFEPSAGYIQWRRAHFNNVMEQAPSVVLIAERVGGTQGAVSASVSLTPGSASTADYGSPSPATLSWSNGESGEKTVSIPLTNDSWDEGREYFTATLGSFTGGAQAGIITTARVSIEDNDFGGPKETGSLVQIIGNNIVIGKDDLQPDLADHTDFGATAVNNTSAAITRTFTIRNLSSNTTLSLTGSPRVQISGSNATDFTVTSQPPATIAANSSATFSVQFLPSQTGTRNATINIPYTLGNPSNYTFAIRGIGTAAASSAGLEVEEITILNETAYLVSQPYTIRNNGYGTLNWTAILPTNYWAISSSTPGGPQYEWIDITSPGPNQGTAITSWGASSTLRDNAVSNTIDIGFSLPFYGQQRSQLRISTNGFLTFNTATTDSVPSNTSLPSSASPGSLVAPWWDDLVLPANQGNVFYRRVDADTFVVTWHRAAYLVGGNPVGDISFQAILKRDGRIIFQYKDIGSPTDSNAYTIGIQNANAANQSSLFAFNSLVAQPGTAVEFRPPGTGDFDPAGSSGNPLSLSTYRGSIGPQGNQPISIYFDPNGLASGQAYRTYFVLQTNDPNNPEYTIPVRLVISREFRLEAIDATNRP